MNAQVLRVGLAVAAAGAVAATTMVAAQGDHGRHHEVPHPRGRPQQFVALLVQLKHRGRQHSR